MGAFANFSIMDYGLAFRLGIFLIYLAINVFSGSLGLLFSSKWIAGFNSSEKKYGYSLWVLFKPLAIMSLIDFFILIFAVYSDTFSPFAYYVGLTNLILMGLVFFVYTIMRDYKESLLRAFLVWLITICFILAVQFSIGVLVSFVIVNFI